MSTLSWRLEKAIKRQHLQLNRHLSQTVQGNDNLTKNAWLERNSVKCFPSHIFTKSIRSNWLQAYLKFITDNIIKTKQKEGRSKASSCRDTAQRERSAARQHQRLNLPFSYAIVCSSTEIREAPFGR